MLRISGPRLVARLRAVAFGSALTLAASVCALGAWPGDAVAGPGLGGGYGKLPAVPKCFSRVPTEAEGYQCDGIITKQATSPTKMVSDDGRFELSSPYAGVDITTPQGCGDLGCVYNHWDWGLGAPAATVVKGCQTNVADCVLQVPPSAGGAWYPVAVSLDNDPPQVFLLYRAPALCPVGLHATSKPSTGGAVDLPSAADRATPLAQAANASEAAHVPVSQRGICFGLYYLASDGFHQGVRFVFGYGSKAAGVAVPGAVGIAAGVLTSETGPGALAVGGLAAGFVGMFTVPLGDWVGDSVISAQDKALADPPDPHFTALARPRVIRQRPLTRFRAIGAHAINAINSWLSAEGQARAVADALGATIDRLGGARQAGDQVWEGKQARLAQTYATQLASLLELVVARQRAAAKAASRVRALTQPLLTARTLAKAQHKVRAHGFTRAYTKFLRNVLHLPGPEVSALRAAVLRTNARTAPRSVAAMIGSNTGITGYLIAAGSLRGYARSPSVVAAANL